MPFTFTLDCGWLMDIENDKLNIQVLILITFITKYTLGTSKEQNIHCGDLNLS